MTFSQSFLIYHKKNVSTLEYKKGLRKLLTGKRTIEDKGITMSGVWYPK